MVVFKLKRKGRKEMQTSETFLLNHLHRFCESQAFTNPRTLETFKKGEAENTDHGLKSENR